MASREDYERDLRAALADPKNELYPYLQHLGQVAESGPLYHGKTGQVHQLRYRGTSTPDDLGGAYATATGAEILASYRAAAGEPRLGIDGVTPVDPEQYYQSLIGELGEELDPNQRYLVSGLGATAKTPFYAPVGKLVTDPSTGKRSLVELQRVAADYDPSRLAGMEQIRAGELDNAINGIKEQLAGAFDANWNQRYAPKLANLPEARRNEIYQKTRDQFWNTLDWSDYIKHDPYVGLYTNMGAVKHVNDKGVDWFTDRVAPIMPGVAAAIVTGNVAAPIAAAASTAATAASGTAVAGSMASAATKALLSSAITAAANKRKMDAKGLLASALASGLASGVGGVVAGATNTGANGIPALLANAATRSALMNRGRVDPRLLMLNTAGAYADNAMGSPVYSLANKAYGAYNTYNRLQSNNGQPRRPVMLPGRNGGLLRGGVKP